MGLKEECGAALEANIKAANTDETLEFEGCKEAAFEVEGISPFVNKGEGVMISILKMLPSIACMSKVNAEYSFSKDSKLGLTFEEDASEPGDERLF